MNVKHRKGITSIDLTDQPNIWTYKAVDTDFGVSNNVCIRARDEKGDLVFINLHPFDALDIASEILQMYCDEVHSDDDGRVWYETTLCITRRHKSESPEGILKAARL